MRRYVVSRQAAAAADKMFALSECKSIFIVVLFQGPRTRMYIRTYACRYIKSAINSFLPDPATVIAVHYGWTSLRLHEKSF